MTKYEIGPILDIHPSKVHFANEVFSPGAAEMTKPKRILAAKAEVLMKKAEQTGTAGRRTRRRSGGLRPPAFGSPHPL